MLYYGFNQIKREVVSPVTQSCQWLLYASNEIAAYQNPPLGTAPAKCDYLFFPNEEIERVPLYVSNLTVDKYYWDSHSDILLVKYLSGISDPLPKH